MCSGPGSDGGGDDAGPTPDAAPRVPWTNIAPLAVPLTAGVGIDDPSLRADELEMFVNVDNSDIARLTRASSSDAWTAPALVSELSTSATIEGSADLTNDGLQVVFSLQDGNGSDFDLHLASRTATTGANAVFGPPVPLSTVNDVSVDTTPAFSTDGLVLVFSSHRTGSGDLFMSTRATADATSPWSPPEALTSINDPTHVDESPYLSADKLTIYFASRRTGNLDMYQATRPDIASPFGTPEPLTELNTSVDESDPWVSPDGKRLYFARANNNDVFSLFSATR